jgi:phage protein D
VGCHAHLASALHLMPPYACPVLIAHVRQYLDVANYQSQQVQTQPSNEARQLQVHSVSHHAGATSPPELQQAAQDTLAAVANTVVPLSAIPAGNDDAGGGPHPGGAGMDAAWARLSDGLLSTNAAAAAAAQAWLLQLLVAAAQRQQQEAPGR